MIRTLLLIVICALRVAGQPAVTLRGVIRDEQGNVLPQARVRVYRQDADTRREAATSGAGEYAIERLAQGAAVFEVEREGFRGVTRPLQIAGGGEQRLDVVLEVAGVAQTVLVTATGAPQSDDEVSKAMSRIGAEEIEARDEYALSDAIRSTPGVFINNSGGPGQNTSIRIRGLRPDASAVLVDGLRFRDASTAQSDASPFISTMNFAGTERVEVLRGSGSSLYGTNAVGGVINVITGQGGAPLHGQLLAEGGGLGLMRGKGAIGGGAWRDRLRYSASLLHLNVMSGVDGDDAARSTGVQGFVRYDLTPSLNLSGRIWGSDDFAQLNVSPATTGIPAANFSGLTTTTIPARMLASEGVDILNRGGRPDYAGVTLIPGRDDPDSRRASRFFTPALVLRHMLTPRVHWQANYQRVHTNRVYSNGPAGAGYQPAAENYSHYRGDIDTADARVTAQAAPWLSFTGGYEFERENYFDRQDNHLPAPLGVVSETRAKQDAHAVYAAAQLALLGRRLQISLSGRRQTFSLERPSFQLTGAANNYDRVPLESPADALTGDVAVSYMLAGTNTKLRAHGGNSYRAPSLYERFGGGFSASPTTGEVIFTPYGDPRLSPDRYNSVDAGVDQYLFASRLRLAATWFYSRVVAVTAFDSAGGIRPQIDPYGRSMGYINGSGGVSRGFELGVEARPLRTLTVTGAYTFVNADLDRDITVQGFWRVFQAPAHVASIVATKRWRRRLDTNLEYFRSSAYYSSFSAAGRARAFEFPGFTKVDLVGGYRVWESEKKTARLYGKAENLFGERYYQNGWLAPRATFTMGVSYGF
jgi:iron complex outermembrane receptor protein